jgi:hypothetical protein
MSTVAAATADTWRERFLNRSAALRCLPYHSLKQFVQSFDFLLDLVLVSTSFKSLSLSSRYPLNC